jgi:hypothetical protein
MNCVHSNDNSEWLYAEQVAVNLYSGMFCSCLDPDTGYRN